MGQNWYLINLDKRLTLPLCGKLGEYLLREGEGTLECLLPPPLVAKSVLQKKERAWLMKKAMISHIGSKSRLLSLPPELIPYIFEALDMDLDGCIALALTCTRMLLVGQPYITKILGAQPGVAAWTDDRILCIGDDTDPDDLPSGMLTEDEMTALLESGNPPHQFWLDTFDKRPRVYEALTSLFSEAQERLHGQECQHWSTYHPWYVAQDIVAFLRYRYVGRILLNMSKKLFVREDVVTALPSSGVVSLGDALLTRICWSSSWSTAVCWDGPLVRGPWAGDRFKFAFYDDFFYGGEMHGWKDATAEVAKDMEEILKGEGMWKGGE